MAAAVTKQYIRQTVIATVDRPESWPISLFLVWPISSMSTSLIFVCLDRPIYG